MHVFLDCKINKGLFNILFWRIFITYKTKYALCLWSTAHRCVIFLGNASVLAGGQVPAKIWGTTISIVKPHKEKAHPQTRTTINIETDDEKGDESERDEAEADSDELEPESTDEVRFITVYCSFVMSS